MAEFYSSANNRVGLIYENFRPIGFEKISGHSILTIWNITQKNFFGARSLVAICKLRVKPGKFNNHAGLTVNIQACIELHCALMCPTLLFYSVLYQMILILIKGRALALNGLMCLKSTHWVTLCPTLLYYSQTI